MPVKFIGIYGREVLGSPSYHNLAEVDAVAQYVQKCFNNDIKPHEIGIVCPYRENVGYKSPDHEYFKHFRFDS